ncbi:3-oxosteroid 1-dehydrogenase [Gordonia metallireducens]|uniref:3-oxosteroid 1-dehydrogenase n=1 Tax=Gordonia metallireducens TaxID=2897779 RepID=UPI001E316CFB|nr:3-oxosteroid 1-dehydrogenase [Gordonia metallireducens]
MNEVDVIVVGSGAGGMASAITAAARGFDVVLLEKSSHWGGSTARSGGGVWIPGNDVLRAHLAADDAESARTYLHAIVGSDDPRIDVYIDRGDEALRFLTEHSALDLQWVRGYSDYLPEQPGGLARGRSCEPRPFDLRRLGHDHATMQPFYTRTPMNVVVQQSDYRWLSTGLRHWQGPMRALRVAGRTALARARGAQIVGLGGALAASLMVGVREAGISVHLDMEVIEVTRAGDRVTGVRCADGTSFIARRGVVVASGGFDHNESMRSEHHRAPAGASLSLGVPSNTGDGIRAAVAVGAATALMDDAWWAPSIPLPKGPWFALAERSLPRSIIVNAHGRRFMNESLPYVEATHRMFGGLHGRGDGPAENLPCWLIFDQTYRNRYMFAGKPARAPLPSSWFDSGALTTARSVGELADTIGVPAAALSETISTFNHAARTGHDAEFHRGESAYDRYYADPTNRPNPSLGEITRPPFYAARIVPADLGTKGGIVTDEHSRALTPDGAPIPGLYAVGNASAALMGHTYAGPGATIGPALVFGYLAALHATDQQDRSQAGDVTPPCPTPRV